MGTTWRYAAAAATLVLALGPARPASAGDTFKQLAAEVPRPADTEPRQLPGLVYKTVAWASQVEAIRLKELPAAGARDVTWILVTRSSQPRLQRVDVELFLLDDQEKRLASAHQTLVMVSSPDPVEQKVKMKLPEGSWDRARAVRIEVRFKAM